MRIGFDAKRAILNRTGLGNYSRGVIELARSHKDIESVVLYSPKSDGSILSNEYLSQSEIELRTPPIYLKGPLSSSWRSKFICKQIEKDGLDLYHGLSNELPSGIETIGLPSLVTIHDLIFLHYPEYYKPIDRKIYNAKVAHACKAATRIIATSNQTARDIVDSLGIDKERISVVYQGCNPIFHQEISESQLEERRERLNLPQQFILSVGTIEPRKNTKSLVEALKRLTNNDVKLLLIGRKTEYANEVQRRAQELGLTERLLIRDNISTEDLPFIYQMAKVFVLPSLMEGFGIPVLEAMASGTPVVVSENGCLGEVCDDAGIHVDPHNIDGISASIDQLLSDPALADECIKKGKARTARFSDERISNDLMEVYRIAKAEF